MKKLLAMILCVMMLASLSVSAFAATPVLTPANKVVLGEEVDENGDPADTYAITRGWAGTAVTKKIIEDTSKAVEKMYQRIAVDQGLFNTLTTVDDMLGDIAKNMYATLDGDLEIGANTFTQKQLEDATKSYLRSAVGGEVNDYMAKHATRFMNDAGTAIDKPVVFLNEYATAISKALSSEKAAKGLEALMTEVMAVNVWKQMTDDYKDFRNDTREWDSDVNGIFFNNAEDWGLNYGFYLNPADGSVLRNGDVMSWHQEEDDDGNLTWVAGYADADGNTYTWQPVDENGDPDGDAVNLGVGVLDYILGNYANTGLTQVAADD